MMANLAFFTVVFQRYDQRVELTDRLIDAAARSDIDPAEREGSRDGGDLLRNRYAMHVVRAAYCKGFCADTFELPTSTTADTSRTRETLSHFVRDRLFLNINQKYERACLVNHRAYFFAFGRVLLLGHVVSTLFFRHRFNCRETFNVDQTNKPLSFKFPSCAISYFVLSYFLTHRICVCFE